MSRYPSIGLATILNEFVSEGDKVLDLGAIASGTSEAFLNLKCSCHFEDLGDFIDSLNENDSHAVEKLETFLMPKPASTKFDYILAWDLFNYLDLSVIERLFTLLEPHLKRGTILHSMQYVGNTQPARPRSYRLLDQHRYEALEAQQEQRTAAKGYRIVDLLKRMHRFSLNDTIMNQQGMEKDVVEYLMEYDKSIEEKKLSHAQNAPLVSYFTQEATYSNVHLPQLAKTLYSHRTNSDLSIFSCGAHGGDQQTVLKQLSHYIYMEDIYASIAWEKKIAVGSQPAMGSQVLKFANDVQFDLLLLWDLFNYCEPQQIKQIIALVSPHLKPTAKLHLFFLNGKQLAAKPSRFHINPDMSVNIIGPVAGTHPNPIQSTGELMRLLPDFKLQGHHYGQLEEHVNFHEFVLLNSARAG